MTKIWKYEIDLDGIVLESLYTSRTALIEDNIDTLPVKSRTINDHKFEIDEDGATRFVPFVRDNITISLHYALSASDVREREEAMPFSWDLETED